MHASRLRPSWLFAPRGCCSTYGRSAAAAYRTRACRKSPVARLFRKLVYTRCMQGQGIAYDMQKVAEEDVPRFVSPRRVVSEFNLWQGDHVLDVASGAGHYIPHLRAAVGPKGRVYAHSAQKAHHELLTRDTVARGHHEVVPLLHMLEDGELDIVAGTIDAVLLANVLSAEGFKTEGLLAEMQRVIRREGKLCVVDWRSREDSERALIALLAEFGFEPKRALSPAATGSYHYGILFTKRLLFIVFHFVFDPF